MRRAAAGLAGEVAAKKASDSAYGLIQGFISAMNKPIYSDLRVDVTTHTTQKGYTVTSTHTKGWNITTGLVIGGLLGVTIYELGLDFAKAVASAGPGGSAAAVNLGALITLNPTLWAIGQLIDAGGNAVKDKNGQPVTYQKPPTAMAALNQVINNLLGPGVTGSQAASNWLMGMLGAKTGLKPTAGNPYGELIPQGPPGTYGKGPGSPSNRVPGGSGHAVAPTSTNVGRPPIPSGYTWSGNIIIQNISGARAGYWDTTLNQIVWNQGYP